ncbi:hypothetical protein C8R46DRAFT_1109227 [Mycena filopes]|nr:hypothetical protein C8R46DRAFT_1109227 [Mycena filopes]
MTASDARRARITEINAEIARLVAERLALSESLTFPVTTLPVEITSEVFLYCVPDDPQDPSSFNPAIALGHVCRQWRDVALSLPQLWTALSVAVDGVVYGSHISTGLGSWLLRSQNRPVTIRLHHRDGACPDATGTDERWWDIAGDKTGVILPTILAHHQRWENVEFNIPLTLLRPLADFTPNDGLPSLRHLLLGSAQEDWGGNDIRPINLFANAPRLRSLHLVLEASCSLSRMDHVRLPYRQLTSFTGTNFSAHECLTVLASTPSLIECVFYVNGRASAFQIGIPPLRHLKSLKLLADVHQGVAVAVVDHLSLPALETLVLLEHGHGHEQLLLSPTLDSLSLRCGYSLLHFSCHAQDYNDLDHCLDSMPALTTLELLDHDQAGLADVIRHLDHALSESGPDQVVPNLQSLTIECHRREKGKVEESSYNAVIYLLSMLATRIPTPLQHFRMVWTSLLLPRLPNQLELQEFKNLADAGMDIYVGSANRSWL